MEWAPVVRAKSSNLILVTNNEKKFARIEGLHTENWMGV